MNAPVTRRSLLGAAAAVSAVALSTNTQAGALAADAVSSDVELFRLLDSYPIAVSAFRLVGDRCEALWTVLSAEEPERPEALHVRPGDGFGLNGDSVQLRDGRKVRVYDFAEIDKLRDMPLPRRSEWSGEPAPWDPREQVGRWISVPDEPRVARRAEILAAHDAWFAIYQAVKDRLGIPAADAADDEATNTLWDLEAAILATVPRTLAGLAAKARWAAGCRLNAIFAADWQKRIVEDVIALAEHGGETS